MDTHINIIGLGKLGLPLTLAYASKGYKVQAVDKNEVLLASIKKAQVSVFENGLKNLLKKYTNNLYISTDIIPAVINSSITFVVVPTPSEKDGNFSLKYILQACKDIGEGIKKKQSRHIVVITSTVSPNSMNIIANKLEKYSGKKIDKDFGLCYSPEFIALGNVLHNFTNPDFILIGESDKKSGDIVEKLRMSICSNKPAIKRTNYINAEIAKLALNTYITTKMSFSNMLARISEKTVGANVDEITSILGSDSRIGPLYLKGGLAYGGPCFPRDNKALSHFINKLDSSSAIPVTIDQFNREQNKYLYDFVINKFGTEKIFGILGLTYKPDTEVIDESSGVYLANQLAKKGVKVNVFDPSVKTKPSILQNDVLISRSMEECIIKSEVVIITTPWKEFKKINLKLFQGNKYLIDCWRLLEKKSMRNINYIPFGVYNS